MKLSWFFVFILVFFLVNVVRVVMAYFGKNIAGAPLTAKPPVASGGKQGGALSRSDIGKAIMDVVEKKLFPDVANLYEGITSQVQLDELVEKIGGALEGLERFEQGVEEGDTTTEDVVEGMMQAQDEVDEEKLKDE
jgi:hypothetical protein